MAEPEMKEGLYGVFTALVVPMMSVGVRGVVSVTSNILPREVLRVVEGMEKGALPLARRKHLRLFPVHEVLFSEPNPQPVKAAAEVHSWMHASLRPPMVEASAETKASIRATFERYLKR